MASGIGRNSVILALDITMIVEGILIFIANTLTLAIFASNKKLRRRSTYLLLSVASADALVGLSAAVLGVLEFTITMTPPLKVAIGFTGHIFTRSSLYGLVLVSVERMHATVWPIRHRTANKRAFLFGVTFQWMLATAISIAAVTANKGSVGSVALDRTKSTISFTGLVVICVCYGVIFEKVKKQQKFQGRAAPAGPRQKERDLARTLFVVTALSLLAWLPDTIFHMALQYNLDNEREKHAYFVVVRYLNSLVNPVVYIVKMPEFRKTLAQLASWRGTAERAQRTHQPENSGKSNTVFDTKL